MLTLQGRGRCPLPDEICRTRCLGTLLSSATIRGPVLDNTAPKPTWHVSVTYREPSLVGICHIGVILVRQGACVYYKAGEICLGLRTDIMSLPSITVIRQCCTFRNQNPTVRNYRFKPHCAENVLNRHNSCVSTKLLLQATHTSSSCFIGRQVC